MIHTKSTLGPEHWQLWHICSSLLDWLKMWILLPLQPLVTELLSETAAATESGLYSWKGVVWLMYGCILMADVRKAYMTSWKIAQFPWDKCTLGFRPGQYAAGSMFADTMLFFTCSLTWVLTSHSFWSVHSQREPTHDCCNTTNQVVELTWSQSCAHSGQAQHSTLWRK